MQQLYALTSTGKIKMWKTWVTDDHNNPGGAIIHTEHGALDGKLQHKIKPITKGKNIGRSNETTPLEQAQLEAQSSYQKKLDKKYIPDLDAVQKGDLPDILLPMLAHKFKDRKHDISWPAIVQPKLNGVRCLAEKVSATQMRLTSRKHKCYDTTLHHLHAPLLEVMEVSEIFDGEVYLHGWTFQQILRRVKKVRPDTDLLQYWIYDVADDEMPSMHRNDRYHDAIGEIFPPEMNTRLLVPLETEMATCEKDVYDYHDRWVSKGYEGVIVRNVNATYKFDHRSADLQKYKEFFDSEFKIIGYEAEQIMVTESSGNFTAKSGIVFSCTTKDDKPFNVKPRGSNAQRIKWFADGDNFIDKQLTVRYQEFSEDGIPIFPVGIAVRDYE
jgi:DNA ligase-1